MKSYTLADKLIPKLFENDELLVISKPAGIDVGEAGLREPSGLLGVLADLREGDETLEPVNRLSRFESGLLILGKNAATVRHLRGELRAGRIMQEFEAVVLGKMKRPHITIKPGSRVEKEKPQGRVKRKSKRPRRGPVAASERASGTTTVHLTRQGDRRALVRCETSVSTTHALRAQLRSAGIRLLGDKLNDRQSLLAGRQGQLSGRSHSRQQAEQTCLHLTKFAIRRAGGEKTATFRTRAPNTFDATTDGTPDVVRALSAALTRRIVCVSSGRTDAYRLLTGDFEGIKGLVVERYGRVGVLHVYTKREALTQALPSIARWYRGTLGLQAVYAKQFMKDRVGAGDDVKRSLHDDRPLVGRAVPEKIEICENALKFWIRPQSEFSAGLFLDHRDNRERVRALSDGRVVLNLFAYTCGFSVAAACGGASSTTSVDLAGGCLDWGRENFELNGLDTTGHEFVQADALDYLQRAGRQAGAGGPQGKRFDLIVLDPPTFSHGRRRKKSFSVSRDLTALIAASLTVLNPDGIIMISTSYRQLSIRDLRDRVRAGSRGRRFKVLDTPPLPVDYAMDRDHAKTMFVQFA